MPIGEVIQVSVPFRVLAVAVVILVASGGVFVVLVRRWTSHRWRTAMAEWARPRRLTVHLPPDHAPLPAVLTPVTTHGSQTLLIVKGELLQIVQLQTTDPPAGKGSGPFRWNLLIRQIESQWPATGLRPVSHRVSALDFFSLSSFPSMGETDRFVVFGTDSTPARVLSKSMGRALLPPDVGLLLIDRWLILDFSTRPFDTIEFGRMIALADQLAGKLPAPN